MTETSPSLSLPYLQPAQAQKHVTHNEALRILDAVTQLSVLTAGAIVPPESPVEGDRHIVGPAAIEEWAGQDQAVALWSDGTWQFFAPQAGWRADLAGTGGSLRFDGAAWVPPAMEAPESLPTLGINANADATNRLTVSAEATLLNNEGAGHQLKLNKADAGDTASLLFQTGFSGRAEMGTAGTNDFAIKVSPDGSTFHTGLSFDAESGAMQVGSGQSYFRDVFILNDTAYSFDIPWSNPARIMLWLSVNVGGRFALIAITGTLTGAGNFAEIFAAPPGALGFHTGVLSGTTGATGGINLSIDSSGGTPRMYLENRLGSNRLFTLATLGR